MCGNENNSTNCIGDLLRKILLLQRQDIENESHSGCDKPYLGPTCNYICYNTRPITLFNCCNGTTWSFPYTINGVENLSSVFRIESLDENCATFRILYLDGATNQYVGTNEFFTINLDCVGAIKCLADTYIDLC